MRLEQTDRVPIHMRGVNAWDGAWVATRHESYGPVIEVVREHGDYQVGWGTGGQPLFTASEELRFEAETIPGDDWNERVTTMHTPRGTLTARHLSSNRGLPGMQVEFFVKDLTDVGKVLSVPYEPLRPEVGRFFELTEELGEDCLVTCDFVDPITPVHDLMGSELLGIWSRTERGTIRMLVDTIAQRLQDLVSYLLEGGVGPVFRTLGQEYAVPPLMSPADFEEFCVRVEAPIGEAIHAAGGLLHVHCHGPMSQVLEGFIDIGANCLHPVEPPPMGDVTLREAKARVGRHICIEGNIQIGDVYTAPTEDIVRQTESAIRDAGPTGFILCPTASPHTEVLPDQAVRNYVAMVETAVACTQ